MVIALRKNHPKKDIPRKIPMPHCHGNIQIHRYPPQNDHLSPRVVTMIRILKNLNAVPLLRHSKIKGVKKKTRIERRKKKNKERKEND